MAKIKTVNGIKEHKVVPNKEWLTARKALLVKEKEVQPFAGRVEPAAARSAVGEGG